MLRCQLKTISHDDNNKMVAKNSIKNFSFTIYHKLILVPCMKMNNFIKKKQKYYIVYEFVFGDMVAQDLGPGTQDPISIPKVDKSF